jgi:hypothetical protein
LPGLVSDELEIPEAIVTHAVDVRMPSRASGVVLSRTEAFELCEVLAEAERLLVRSGRGATAARLATAFELLEDRLFGDRAASSAPPS